MVEWISHRGIRRGCAENSFKAFSFARNAGFKWLETDVRISADGVLLLAHDADLSRVYGRDLVIESTDFATLSSMRSREGDHLLRFDDFADEFSSLNWVLDIKPESVGRVISTFQSEKYRDLFNSRLSRTKFLFWNRSLQAQFLSVFPQADCFAREFECWRAGLAALLHVPYLGGIRAGKTYAVPPDLRGVNLFSHAIFSEFHKKGAKVLAYLPETRQQANEAVAAGADYVLANEPLFQS